ncbi:alkaline phosphatase family protein [Novosphingobium cyanobacteriorum]|uniref:Ectonucleotide pyrophosphatase/phosphodiesterase n=1 Tax=Novosphingobium cyanobacteriorum TaxID=3024215 RepID=A0ABT6CHD6_9SPHN|nr:ectonucleotide pyrophosphatase/phosphodiesterase [Novosphingobium cyanobacteriorum]MDF8333340.1 ectonucleotide pyrophosphatase/phosphodiesterase [Novosphingobium cyanobacteriorum]
MKSLLLGAAALIGAAAFAAPAQAKSETGGPVLLISIDGLRPGDVLEAEKRGLKLPNLTRFVKEGVSATGVVGVLPTLTYPSHTTLITGVAPAAHGIVNNQTFDPTQINQSGWFWYAEDEKARTLWDAAHDAGLSTGNVHWPVSVGAHNLTWNVPQIWRTGHADDAKLIRALATPGLVQALEHDCGGPYADGIDESLPGDQNRAKFAVKLIEAHRPDFVTVYLAALDHQEHATGPGSAEANRTLEAIDALVGDMVAAEAKAHPDALVSVVSDHGFAPVDTVVNLYRAFIDAGLVTLDDKGRIKAWDAVPWASGGSFAIMLARPDDAALKDKVGALLARLQADPAARFAEVIGKDAIAKAGANPQATFYVNLKLGAVAAPFITADTPLTIPSPSKGMHGYFPAAPEMRSTFLAMGPGVAKGRNLGEIDMRAIAPTLARAMGGTLPDAQVQALDLAK